MTESIHIPRRATLSLLEEGQRRVETRLLSDWRDLGAYVLLAEPGAGKTDALKRAAQSSVAQGEPANYVKAIDFVSLPRFDAWRGHTLFIDGVDEMRVETTGGGDPLHELRGRLVTLGCPRFRLTCRQAEWRGEVDRLALAEVIPDGRVSILTLDPMTAEEIHRLLEAELGNCMSAANFTAHAHDCGLDDLLNNPLMLDLLVRSTRHGQDWPNTKAGVFQSACREMLQLETAGNLTHRSARRRGTQPSLDESEHQAGLLATTLLLCGADRFTTETTAVSEAEIPISDLPSAMRLLDPIATLRTGVFDRDADARTLRHRAIGEYMAAAAIATKTLHSGLPFGRILALMTGSDGGVVEPLRGLHAWLAVHQALEREQCIQRDPVGVLLYGDPKAFSALQKVMLFDALATAAAVDSDFPERVATANALGPLAIQELLPAFRQGLAIDCHEPGHVRLLGYALLALRHGDAFPSIVGDLDAYLRRDNRPEDLRVLALNARWRQSGNDSTWAVDLLHEISIGNIQDPDDELCGHLLNHLFPQHLEPIAVLQHLHPAKNVHHLGEYWWFWTQEFPSRMPKSIFREVLDRLADQPISVDATDENSSGLVANAMDALLLEGLAQAGNSSAPERIYRWLGIGLDRHGSGSFEPRSDEIRGWIEARPNLHLELLRHGLETAPTSSTAEFSAAHVNERLRHARRSQDHVGWMLSIAASTTREDVARYCIGDAAQGALRAPPGTDTLMTQVTDWLSVHQSKWPMSRLWVDDRWQSQIDDWRAEDARRRRKLATDRTRAQVSRRSQLLPFLDALRAGKPPPGLLHNLAMAYDGRFTDIRAETPEGRLHEYLGGSEAETHAAIRSILKAPWRNDLPSPDKVFALAKAHNQHSLHKACLLAASLAEADGTLSESGWPEGTVHTMVAFWLVEPGNQPPGWFKRTAQARPALVAELLVKYTALQYKSKSPRPPSILWRLADTSELSLAGKAALPDLLRRFPARANAEQLTWLRNALLPAAGALLPQPELGQIIERRLQARGLDDGQRVSWLALNVHQAAAHGVERLVSYLGNSQARAAHLAKTWQRLPNFTVSIGNSGAHALAALIETLAPFAPASQRLGVGWVGDTDSLHYLMRGLIHQLASAAPPESGKEIRRLRVLPALESWRWDLDSELSAVVLAERAASFRHATVAQLARTLNNGKPANPRDLAELVVAHLKDTERHLRGHSANQLVRFWHLQGETWALRSENECRDVLVLLLENDLKRLDVAITPEVQAAFAKRADFKAHCLVDGIDIRLPGEVKRQDHRDMWTAWRDQLDRWYTADPWSSGLGLYVVLWWGARVRSHAGLRPTSSKELEHALNRLMNQDERSRLRAVVLDLSWPTGAKHPQWG